MGSFIRAKFQICVLNQCAVSWFRLSVYCKLNTCYKSQIHVSSFVSILVSMLMAIHLSEIYSKNWVYNTRWDGIIKLHFDSKRKSQMLPESDTFPIRKLADTRNYNIHVEASRNWYQLHAFCIGVSGQWCRQWYQQIPTQGQIPIQRHANIRCDWYRDTDTCNMYRYRSQREWDP